VASLPHYEPAIRLAPHSGVQFVTRHLNLPDASRFRRSFIERSENPGAEQTRRNVWLLPDWSPDDPSRQGITEDEQEGEERYTINAEKALEPYLGKWVPVPYLRAKTGRVEGGGRQFDKGPTNWVRVRVIEQRDAADPAAYTHRVIFAFDTETGAAPRGPAGPYTAPNTGDVEGQRQFHFVPDMSRLSWFIQGSREAALSRERSPQDDPQLWVEEWLEALFREFRQSSHKASGQQRMPALRYVHEHAARWYAFVDLIAEFAQPPAVSFIDTVSARVNEIRPEQRMVDVDFVLDVGNSRTCGILVERFPNQSTIDLNKCRPLRLRDLSQPELVYTEAFESHAELAPAEFGIERFSRVSGRARAFFWPSAVRIGPEAARIRGDNTAGNTTGGVSSPKRYLWDMEAVNQEWRFPAECYVEGFGPPVEQRLRRYVNQNGDVLSKVRTDGKIFKSLYGRQRAEDVESTPGPRLAFSRSSFYTFMLAEVIWQAWVMINDPAVRAEGGEAGLPRRLRKIILTLPTATPVREQRIMRARAESAVALLWDMMGWTDNPPSGVARPEVEVKWDEATCVQLVWLYGEIARKFAGNVAAFLKLTGRERGTAGSAARQPCLRVASIDIGGGTTDLMIITYTQLGDQGLRPEQNFREGVRIAGDDILKLVIERLLIPAIQHHLQGSGLPSPAAQMLLRACFDSSRTAEDEHRRWQITTEVMVPAALALLHAYESAPPGLYDRIETRTLADLVRQEGQVRNLDRVADFIERRAHDAGAKAFRLAETPVHIDCDLMRSAVNDAMGQVFDIMSETLDHFDVDVLVLSGRPARLPAVSELIADRFALPPSRIVPLHRYRAGNWFPFRATETGRIADPKTAVVVGALLCNYAHAQLSGFYFQTDRILMKSTAQYIGVLDGDGKMKSENVWFPPPPRTGELQEIEDIPFYGTRLIGSRQLPHERWVTAPLYQLSIDTTGPDLVPQPVRITVERKIDDPDPARPDQLLEAEARMEQIQIKAARDATGKSAKERMKLTFRTIDSDAAAYWLDTGLLRIP
jgi:hypothetical protein